MSPPQYRSRASSVFSLDVGFRYCSPLLLFRHPHPVMSTIVSSYTYGRQGSDAGGAEGWVRSFSCSVLSHPRWLRRQGAGRVGRPRQGEGGDGWVPSSHCPISAHSSKESSSLSGHRPFPISSFRCSPVWANRCCALTWAAVMCCATWERLSKAGGGPPPAFASSCQAYRYLGHNFGG